MNIPAFERKLNLLIGIPSDGGWRAKFGISLTNMITYLMSDKVPGYRESKIQPFQIRGSILSRSRAKIVQQALKDHCTHILFVDTDQTFPRDTAHRLLTSGKLIIGCNIATKQIPASPTARRKSPNRPDGEPVYTDPDSPRLERVWRLGTGIMLIDMRVFEKIGPRCFGITWNDQLQDYQGEDWSMCEAMESAGFEIWVDHRLSDEVGHLGEFEFNHEVVGTRELREDKAIGER